MISANYIIILKGKFFQIFNIFNLDNFFIIFQKTFRNAF